MSSALRIPAVILAAGESRRMGRPKALLDLGSGNVLQRIVRTLQQAGFERPGVVIGAHREVMLNEANALFAHALVNENWRDGRFSSVRHAARWAVDQEGIGGLLLWPVDCPGVRAPTVQRLVDAFRQAPEINHVPIHRDRGGHPVLLSLATVRAIADTEGDANLRDFVRGPKTAAPNSLCRLVDVDDSAVLDNLDTPADYQDFLARNRPTQRGPDPLVAVGQSGESVDIEAHTEFARLAEKGEAVVLVTVIGSEGSAPRGMGAAMAVRADGSIVGTVGGGSLEVLAIRHALESLEDGKPRRFHYDYSCGPDQNLDKACTGKTDFYVQPCLPRPALLIFGAGHIARALAPMAQTAGFLVSVFDDRRGFPDPQLFPQNVRFHHGSYRKMIEEITIDSNCYIVIVTHGHTQDEAVLTACLHRSWRYLGMIGSRKKVGRVFHSVGVDRPSRAALGKVHAPIGLNLGGRAPGEIAASILAELIAVRYGRKSVDFMHEEAKARASSQYTHSDDGQGAI